MRAQGVNCFAKDCTVRVYSDDGSLPHGSDGILFSDRGVTFCKKHGDDEIELERDLTNAIMELHAYSLITSQDPSLSVPLLEALARARRLRTIERNLYGD